MKNLLKQRAERTRWFIDARFGLFVHWGLYAIPSKSEWNASRTRTAPEKYMEYFREFDPVGYDPRQWAKAAKGTGMKYAVLTAKHHDGFCLFDSALTEFKATNTPVKRDLVREYVNAFRSEGLGVGFYYSLLDWNHPEYPHYGEPGHPMRDNEEYSDKKHDFSKYVDYMHGQIRELCSNYGQIDILWLDFSYGERKGETWRAGELVDMIRSLQPGIVINHRLEGSGSDMGSILTANPSACAGDFLSLEVTITPETVKDELNNPVPWESCFSINDSWGYVSADRNFKPADLLVRKLVECVAKGGNMLLNVGPDAKGRLSAESLQILGQAGAWMKDNHDSLYRCGSASYPKPEWGWFTQNDNKLYAHILDRQIGAYHLPVPPADVKRIRLLSNSSELLPFEPWNAVAFPQHTFIDLGFNDTFLWDKPKETDTVLEIELR